MSKSPSSLRGGWSIRPGNFQAINHNLASLQAEILRLTEEIESLKANQYKANDEGDSNVYIVPKQKPDTGELRRRRFYLHEKIAERFNPSELVGLMYSLGIDPGDIAGETHNDHCLQLVMYCDRHGQMSDLLEKLRHVRPRQKWNI